jgi:RNA polymerase sigma-70 factor (ECF subfamily)
MHAFATCRSSCVSGVSGVWGAEDQAEGEGCREGGLPAFAAALKEHLPALRAKAARLERTASDAEDLVQDTLERALRSWQRYAPGSNLRSWLHTVMHNLFLDHCRARNRRELVGIEAGHDPAWTGEPPEDPHEPATWESVSMTEVQDLSRGLRPPLRDAVELVFFCGLNYEQAAERLRIPKATVGTRLLRARRQLRQQILDRLGREAGPQVMVSMRIATGTSREGRYTAPR